MEASKYTVAAVVVDLKCKVSMKGDGSNRRSLEASKCQQRVVAVSTVTASIGLMLHFLSGDSATLAVQEVVVIDPRAVALYTATIVVAALGINIKGLLLEAVLRNKARLGAPKATSASIE